MCGNFWIKIDKHGQLKRRKARFFAKGYRQVKGIDFQESFAPVVRYDSLRVVLAIAASHDLELVQLDVKTAFLNGEVDEEIYIAQPKGYTIAGRELEVCRLNKAIYGIRQASRIWNQKLHLVLQSFGLNQCNADPCIYSRIGRDDTIIFTIWVDDGLVAGSNMIVIKKLIALLQTEFEIVYGPADHFVGIAIHRDRLNKRIYLSAQHYIDKILAKFNMSNAHPVSLPADKGGIRLSKNMEPVDDEERESMSKIPYREAVGCIMYAAITLRPDIAFQAVQIAQHCENPGLKHWNAVKRVLRYLAGTKNHGLCFGGSESNLNEIVGYSDADYGGDIETRRSTSGSIFKLNGGPVTWSSKKQPIVVLSTMESEYIAASDTGREAKWLRLLLSELGLPQKSPTKIWCDNESAIALARNPEYHKRSKHIDVRYHHLRELVFNKVIDIEYVNTKEQLADFLTKPVDIESSERIKKNLGIVKVLSGNK
jgi:hypothetical protein